MSWVKSIRELSVLFCNFSVSLKKLFQNRKVYLFILKEELGHLRREGTEDLCLNCPVPLAEGFRDGWWCPSISGLSGGQSDLPFRDSGKRLQAVAAGWWAELMTNWEKELGPWQHHPQVFTVRGSKEHFRGLEIRLCVLLPCWQSLSSPFPCNPNNHSTLTPSLAGGDLVISLPPEWQVLCHLWDVYICGQRMESSWYFRTKFNIKFSR